MLRFCNQALWAQILTLACDFGQVSQPFYVSLSSLKNGAGDDGDDGDGDGKDDDDDDIIYILGLFNDHMT